MANQKRRRYGEQLYPCGNSMIYFEGTARLLLFEAGNVYFTPHTLKGKSCTHAFDAFMGEMRKILARRSEGDVEDMYKILRKHRFVPFSTFVQMEEICQLPEKVRILANGRIEIRFDCDAIRMIAPAGEKIKLPWVPN